MIPEGNWNAIKIELTRYVFILDGNFGDGPGDQE